MASDPRFEPDTEFYYVTKNYFTLGICRVRRTNCEELTGKRLMLNAHTEESKSRTLGCKDWYDSPEAAQERVKALIANKILSLDRQIARLKARKPEKEQVTNISFPSE